MPLNSIRLVGSRPPSSAILPTSSGGQGPAALFLHAFPLNGFQWREVVEDLAPIRRCIAPDLMGLGYTRVRPEQEISFETQAAAMVELLDSLKIAQVDLVGNDTGAGISQIFTAQHPSRVRSLTLTNCEVHNLWPNAMLEPLLEAFAAGAAAPVIKSMAQDVDLARKQLASTYEDPERFVTPELTQLYFEPLIESEERAALLRADWKRNREQLVRHAAQLRASAVPAQVIWGEADTPLMPRPRLIGFAPISAACAGLRWCREAGSSFRRSTRA